MTIPILKQNLMSKNIVNEYHIDSLTEENDVIYENCLCGKTMQRRKVQCSFAVR